MTLAEIERAILRLTVACKVSRGNTDVAREEARLKGLEAKPRTRHSRPRPSTAE